MPKQGFYFADFTADDDYYAGMLAMVEKAGIMRFCDIEAEVMMMDNPDLNGVDFPFAGGRHDHIDMTYAQAPFDTVLRAYTRSHIEQVVSRRIRLELAWTRWNQTTSRIEEQLVDLGREPDSQGRLWIEAKDLRRSMSRVDGLLAKYRDEEARLLQCCREEYDSLFLSTIESGAYPDAYMYTASACDPRLKLTPSAPFSRGAVWYHKRLKVRYGFKCSFAFRITARSQVCSTSITEHTEGFASKRIYTGENETCSDAGGDGFAFVIHNDARGASAIGADGEGLGYSGLQDSLAIEFDTRRNDWIGDQSAWHVGINSGGRSTCCTDSGERIGGLNSASHSASLAIRQWVPEALGPGRSASADAVGGWGFNHTVDIIFRPGFAIDISHKNEWSFVAPAAEFVKAHGLGTLTVDVDKTTILMLPVSIDALMTFADDDEAWVGLTAATGWNFQSHEILWWRLWEEEQVDPSDIEFKPAVQGGRSFRPGITAAPTLLPTAAPAW